SLGEGLDLGQHLFHAAANVLALFLQLHCVATKADEFFFAVFQLLPQALGIAFGRRLGLTSRLVHLYGAINLLFQRLKIVGWSLIWHCFDCIGRHKRTFPNKEVRTCSQYTPDFCGGMGPSVHFLAGLKSLTTKDTKVHEGKLSLMWIRINLGSRLFIKSPSSMNFRGFRAGDFLSFSWVVIILGLAALIVGGRPEATSQTSMVAKSRSNESRVARGKYIVEGVAMCGMCHTPR